MRQRAYMGSATHIPPPESGTTVFPIRVFVTKVLPLFAAFLQFPLYISSLFPLQSFLVVEQALLGSDQSPKDVIINQNCKIALGMILWCTPLLLTCVDPSTYHSANYFENSFCLPLYNFSTQSIWKFAPKGQRKKCWTKGLSGRISKKNRLKIAFLGVSLTSPPSGVCVAPDPSYVSADINPICKPALPDFC